MLLGIFAVICILSWAILGMVALGHFQNFTIWLNQPGNTVRIATWISAVIAAVAFWLLPLESELRELAPELTGIAITVVVIDELGRYRAYLERKQEIIEQIGSSSNDFALEAVRIANKHNWLKNGVLRGASLAGANLERANFFNVDLSKADLSYANLYRANLMASNLSGADLRFSKLQGALLAGANLSGALLSEANLEHTNLNGANLENAHLGAMSIEGIDALSLNWGTVDIKGVMYDNKTIWPEGFTPPEDAVNIDISNLSYIDTVQ